MTKIFSNDSRQAFATDYPPPPVDHCPPPPVGHCPSPPVGHCPPVTLGTPGLLGDGGLLGGALHGLTGNTGALDGIVDVVIGDGHNTGRCDRKSYSEF